MTVNRMLLKGTLGRMREEAKLDCRKGTVESFVPDTVHKNNTKLVKSRGMRCADMSHVWKAVRLRKI